MESTIRSNIYPGLHVGIVQKLDQPTGELTEGVVQDILTSFPTHPRGIKVRLTSGLIGRVQRIFRPGNKNLTPLEAKLGVLL